jgi:hypothetical protein
MIDAEILAHNRITRDLRMIKSQFSQKGKNFLDP